MGRRNVVMAWCSLSAEQCESEQYKPLLSEADDFIHDVGHWLPTFSAWRARTVPPWIIP